LSNVVRMPVTRDLTPNFVGVIKNKRNIESLRIALNTELARVKIEANEVADAIDANVKALMEVSENQYNFLFADIQQIITKPKDDLINLAKMRITEHKQAEAKRMEAERERIRKEEEAKAKAEQERIREEEQAEAEQRRIEATKQADEAKARETAEKATEQQPVSRPDAFLPTDPGNIAAHKYADNAKTATVTEIKPMARHDKHTPPLMEAIAAWADAWRIPVEATCELVQIIEEHLPEQSTRTA